MTDTTTLNTGSFKGRCYRQVRVSKPHAKSQVWWVLDDGNHFTSLDGLIRFVTVKQIAEATQPDPDDEPVTITVTKNHARVILAALSRRCDELTFLGGSQAEALSNETREIYQSVDGQVYGVKS